MILMMGLIDTHMYRSRKLFKPIYWVDWMKFYGLLELELEREKRGKLRTLKQVK